MGATLFSIDSNAEKREDKLRDVTSRIEDLNAVLYTTNQSRRGELSKIAETIACQWAVVRREKIIFTTLNLWKFDSGRKTLLAEGWVPTRDIPRIQGALREASVCFASQSSGVIILIEAVKITGQSRSKRYSHPPRMSNL